MLRRNFLKGIVAAIACAAIPMGMKKPLAHPLFRNHDMDSAFVFDLEKYETPFGAVYLKTHPLFETQP